MTGLIYIIIGPTAVGKSEIAMRIADKLDAWIISADSRQVFRGMDIGTAKPSESDRAKVRHFLIDVVDPDCGFSAGEFLTGAKDAIKKAFDERKNVLVVGGTGLYVRALVKGFDLANTPGIEEIRKELELKSATHGYESLIKELSELDPEAAKASDLNNPRRVIRTLEIIKATGKPLHQSRGKSESEEYRFLAVGLRRSREILNQRIKLRTYDMIHDGWIDEVRDLMTRNYSPESPAMSGIGYRELREYLNSETTLELALGRIITRTRQFAKRQMTWFNAEDYVNWVDISPDDESRETGNKVLNIFCGCSVI